MLVLRTHSTPTKDEHKHKSGHQYFTILKTLSEKKAEELIVGLSHHPPPPLIDCQRWGAELCFFSCVAQSIVWWILLDERNAMILFSPHPSSPHPPTGKAPWQLSFLIIQAFFSYYPTMEIGHGVVITFLALRGECCLGDLV